MCKLNEFENKKIDVIIRSLLLYDRNDHKDEFFVITHQSTKFVSYTIEELYMCFLVTNYL